VNQAGNAELTMAHRSVLLAATAACLIGLGRAGVPVDVYLEGRSLNAPPALSMTQGNLTSKWFDGSSQVQIIEALITNTDSSLALTSDDTLTVTASGASVNSAQTGTVYRLLPGQSAVVRVGVTNKAGVAGGAPCSVTLTATWGQSYGKSRTTTSTISGTCGFGMYSPTGASVNSHTAPDWYNDAKFGIFIHWGPYAAPAYGSVAPNEDYAEWYWYRMHDPNYRTKTYQYHQRTYGTSFNYDDFFTNFTGANFNAKAWLDVIAGSGAQYFVPVTSTCFLFFWSHVCAGVAAEEKMKGSNR
jgi:alpha-L-fucosidase